MLEEGKCEKSYYENVSENESICDLLNHDQEVDSDVFFDSILTFNPEILSSSTGKEDSLHSGNGAMLHESVHLSSISESYCCESTNDVKEISHDEEYYSVSESTVSYKASSNGDNSVEVSVMG